MMDLIRWAGIAVCGIGAASFIAAALWLLVMVVDHLGSALWKKLLALYDLRTLQYHLRVLDAQGKTLRKQEEHGDD